MDMSTVDVCCSYTCAIYVVGSSVFWCGSISILNGFVWNEKTVYLSSENQFNFKAAYDLAVQTSSQSLPITFKLGESNGVPVYHTFEQMSEFTDFYTKAVAFINQTLAEGWAKKDSFDWSLYVDTPVTEQL